jgi:hypothetical protein
MDEILPPHDQFPLVDKSGNGENRFFGWIRAITRRVNSLTPLKGAGSPEGVVEAALHRQYIDTTYPVGATLYLKTTATGNTGWQAIG